MSRILPIKSAIVGAALCIFCTACTINIGSNGGERRAGWAPPVVTVNVGSNAVDNSPVRSETRTLPSFSAIYVSGIGQVDVTPGEPQVVTIEANDKSLLGVLTRVSGNVLDIHLEQGTNPASLHIQIKAPNIDDLHLSGAVNANLNAGHVSLLTLAASGATKISAAGEAKTAHLEASGASTIAAEQLITQDCNVTVSGASHADVSATKNAKVSASGASSVNVHGKPAKVDQDSSGTSTITVL